MALLSAFAFGPAAPSAHAEADQRVFTTTVEGSDVTEFSVRSGKIGDRCSSWSTIDGVVTTKLARTTGKMTYTEAPGITGPFVTHTLDKTKVTMRMATKGTSHLFFPCGCGPNSELGECPTPEPDVSLAGTCKQSDQGSLGLIQQKLRLVPLVAAPMDTMIERCDPTILSHVPEGVTLAAEVFMRRSAIWDVRRMKVGEKRTFKSTMAHAGKEGRCGVLEPDDPIKKFCGKQTFTMVAKRTK